MATTKERYEEIVEKVKELKQNEQSIIIENMPVFERGIAEASIERENVVWNDLRDVFIKHRIQPDINFALVSDNQASNDSMRPVLTCAGVKVSMTYLVYPIDKKEKSGRIAGDDFDKVQDIRSKVEELENELKEE